MAYSFVDLVVEPVPTSQNLVYTIPSNAIDAKITYCAAHNYSASAPLLTLNFAKSGDSPGVTNQYYNDYYVASESKAISEVIGRTLKAGDMIYCVCDTSNAINLSFSVKIQTS